MQQEPTIIEIGFMNQFITLNILKNHSYISYFVMCFELFSL
ncbi:hypothetical protein ECN1_1158 [Escherichia coli N1]|nr:hypothetical protein ECN1_1158 [Escherichia coli N1]